MTEHTITDGEDRYKVAWQEYDERFRWMQGNNQLSQYLGWHYADIANDLIDRAYPGLRIDKAPPTAEQPAQDGELVEALEALPVRARILNVYTGETGEQVVVMSLELRDRILTALRDQGGASDGE